PTAACPAWPSCAEAWPSSKPSPARTPPRATRTATSPAPAPSTAAASRPPASAPWARTAGCPRPWRPAPRPWKRPERGPRRPCTEGHFPLHPAALCCSAPQTGVSRLMIYQLHELNRQLLAPFTELAQANAKIFGADGTWLSSLPGATRVAAGNELLHRIGKDYEKPPFAIHQVVKDGHDVPVVEKVALDKPFCRLLRFKRYTDDAENILGMKDQPTVLVVAPLSGHHATLLRDTVRTLLPEHKVYITDWVDARMVPREAGAFTLDDYVGYIQEFIRHIGAERLHVVSVCQPTVPVLAAVSLMAARGEDLPRSLVMMGGPIDTRSSPTAVNDLAATRPLWWFENNVIHVVPANYPGRGRRVYPGCLPHAGFVAMNPERHFMSHWDFYQDLVKGDLEDAQSHRR